MLQLLFALILAEMAMIVMFVFKTPLRKLIIMGIDRAKRGRGPIVAKTVSGTVLVLMVSTGYNAAAVRQRWIQDGEANPTDQILFARNLLEASLMGSIITLESCESGGRLWNLSRNKHIHDSPKTPNHHHFLQTPNHYSNKKPLHSMPKSSNSNPRLKKRPKNQPPLKPMQTP